jgi:hypothetical protein
MVRSCVRRTKTLCYFLATGSSRKSTQKCGCRNLGKVFRHAVDRLDVSRPAFPANISSPPRLKSAAAPAQRHAAPLSCSTEPGARSCSTPWSLGAASMTNNAILERPRPLNGSSRARFRLRNFQGDRQPTPLHLAAARAADLAALSPTVSPGSRLTAGAQSG